MNEKRDEFPCIPEKSWWILRQKFKESIPDELTKFYVSNLLNISPQAAWDSVVRQMRMIGLIDDRGKPTALAARWKDEDKYPRVCIQIIKNTYPQELIDLFPKPSAPAAVVAKWFKEACLCEGSLGRRCAEFYLLLLEGNPARAKEVLRDPDRPLIEKMTQKSSNAELPFDQEVPEDESRQPLTAKTGSPKGEKTVQPPTIHIDFHIHITPEATPQKVDKIFQRIAKHLKSFKKG